ncbi:MAG: ParA family protein [Planctomycetes bacterium]|nr:ParA family protein [Planctomycetota bacterium]
MRRIAIINQKGGVGKTTTTTNLGAALARRGKRVLVVDIDPQANLSIHVDVDITNLEHSTYTLLVEDSTPAQAIRSTSTPNLDVLPTNIDLSGAELELANAIGRETILRDKLAQHFKEHGEYDFVLYDCPPSLGLLSLNALAAADEVFIPVQTEFFALQGMTKLMQVVELVRGRINPTLRITAIVPCLVDPRTNLASEVLAELRAVFPHQVLATRIRKNIRLAEAPSHGKTIFDYAPESSGARDYDDLAAEVLGVSSHSATMLSQSQPSSSPRPGGAAAAPGH